MLKEGDYIKKIIIPILLLITIFITGCTNNDEYYKEVAGEYEMYELKTAEGNIYNKDELKEQGYSGVLKLYENGKGEYNIGEQKQNITYDRDYIYYPSNNTKDNYEYEDENIVLISDIGGRLKFIRKKD